MINSLRQWILPALISQKLYAKLPNGKYMALTPDRYSEAQHHYRNEKGQVISLPPIHYQGKEICFASVTLQGGNLSASIYRP